MLPLSLTLSLSSLSPSFPPLDNDYEIGEEPEHTWGWNRYKGKGKKSGRGKTPRHYATKLDGWMSKRKKIYNLIDECDAILTSASDRLDRLKSKESDANTVPSPLTAANLSSLPGSSKMDDKKTEGDSDSDTVTYDYEGEEGRDGGKGRGDSNKASAMVECPLCGEMFPCYAIEVHAGSCGDNSSPVGLSVYGPIVID